MRGIKDMTGRELVAHMKDFHGHDFTEARETGQIDLGEVRRWHNDEHAMWFLQDEGLFVVHDHDNLRRL